MTTTAQNVIDRVRVITGDKFSSQFVDADIIRWINDALDMHKTSVEWGKTVLNLTSVKGQYAYPTGGHILIHDVYYNGTQLTSRSVDQINDFDPYRLTSPSTAIGVPQYYWEGLDNSGNQVINLYVTPDTTNLPIVVTALAEPSNIVSGGDGLP